MLTKIVNGVEVTVESLEEQSILSEWNSNINERNNYIATLKYKDDRIREYPTIGDQLDALWHAMDSGLLTIVPNFYDPINVVKTKYPKPI